MQKNFGNLPQIVKSIPAELLKVKYKIYIYGGKSAYKRSEGETPDAAIPALIMQRSVRGNDGNVDIVTQDKLSGLPYQKRERGWTVTILAFPSLPSR